MGHLAKTKRLKSKALIEENGYSGEYAPAFSNKLHMASLSKSITKHLSLFKLLFGSSLANE